MDKVYLIDFEAWLKKKYGPNLYRASFSRKMGLTRSFLNSVINGNAPVGKRLAAKLEKASGISRLHFLYPEEFGLLGEIREEGTVGLG